MDQVHEFILSHAGGMWDEGDDENGYIQWGYSEVPAPTGECDSLPGWPGWKFRLSPTCCEQDDMIGWRLEGYPPEQEAK